MNILVLDAGTSSMRGTLMNEKGAALRQESVTYSPSYLENGWVEQAAEDWSSALETICLRLAPYGPADALALTAQRSSVIPVDGDGTPLRPAIMWQDTRSQEICQALSGEGERVAALCGCGVNTVFSGSKMTWLRRNEPEVYRRTASFFTVADYLIFRMTGQRVSDHTYGSRSMLMNLNTRQWSPELLELFEVEEEKLCTLIPPSSIAGWLSADFAGVTGLRPGIPVVTCGGDQQCGALGQGVTAPGAAAVNLGTGAYLTAAAERFDPSGGLVCNASGIPDQFILESSVLTCGSALDWFLRELCPGGSLYLVEEALRRSAAGANGVLVLPYFQGRSGPDWDSAARASFHGLSLAATRLDLLRALLEGICREIACKVETIERSQKTGALHVSGGLSRSDGVNQLLADVSGKQVVCFGQGDATTRGAWMSAACCLGVCGSWAQAWERVRPKECRTYFPRPEAAALYRSQAQAAERLYGEALRRR